MADRVIVGSLIPDDFFEVDGDPCVYSVDLSEDGAVIATDCQTGRMYAFQPNGEVDFLYR